MEQFYKKITIREKQVGSNKIKKKDVYIKVTLEQLLHNAVDWLLEELNNKKEWNQED